MSKLLIAKEPNSEKSQPKLYLVTDVLPNEIEDDQLPFCEESKKTTKQRLAYRHGLRVGEFVSLRWSQIDFSTGRLHVNRLKKGDSSVQNLDGVELRSLRALQRSADSPFDFSSERGASLTTRAFQLIVARAGEIAKIGFPCHPHQLRHATGYALATDSLNRHRIKPMTAEARGGKYGGSHFTQEHRT